MGGIITKNDIRDEIHINLSLEINSPMGLLVEVVNIIYNYMP